MYVCFIYYFLINHSILYIIVINISVLCSFSLHLSNIIQIFNNDIKNKKEIDDEKLKSLSYLIDSFFQLTIKGLSGTKTIEWSSENGLLSYINNITVLNILSFIITLSLQHLHHSASVRIDWKPSRFDQSLSNLEWMKNIKCLTLSNEYGILLIHIETLLRYHNLDPNDLNVLLALGDAYHFIEKHNYAIKYYIKAGNIESDFFTDIVIPDSIIKSIQKLITSFIGLKRFDIATVLKQFVSSKDNYSDLYSLVLQYGLYFKENYIDYLYEIPIIELLISMYFNLLNYIYIIFLLTPKSLFLKDLCHKNDEKGKLNLLINHLRKPELNENIENEQRKKIILSIKRKFFKQLTKEFLLDS